MPGKYESSPPTGQDGDIRTDKHDQNNNKYSREAYRPEAEDNSKKVIKVQSCYDNFNISTATTTTVKSGAGHIKNIRVLGGTLGNVTIYDNTAGSGTVLCPTVTPVANGILIEDCEFATGLTIVTAAATIIVGATGK